MTEKRSGAACSRGRLFRLPIFKYSDVVSNPFQVRLLILMVMQVMTVMAIISQAALLYRDIKWNDILDGSALVSFPTPSKIMIARYINWDDPQVKNVLGRQLVIPVLTVILLVIILIINMIAQMYDSDEFYLLVESIVYFIFGLLLVLLAFGGVYYTIRSTRKGYEDAATQLLELTPLDEDVYPDRFPTGNPISIKGNPQYFLQVVSSCQDGNVAEWEQKSDLMGITKAHITIPSYQQLVNMGFCINWSISYFPTVFLCFLSILCWLNVVLCLRSRSKEFLLRMCNLPTKPHTSPVVAGEELDFEKEIQKVLDSF